MGLCALSLRMHNNLMQTPASWDKNDEQSKVVKTRCLAYLNAVQCDPNTTLEQYKATLELAVNDAYILSKVQAFDLHPNIHDPVISLCSTTSSEYNASPWNT